MDILKITTNIKEIGNVFKQIRISLGMSISDIANIIDKGKSSWQRYESERYWMNVTKFETKIKEVSFEISNGIFEYYENYGAREIYIQKIQSVCQSYIKDSKLYKHMGNYKIDFLKKCKTKMQKGSYLCIAENFIPESYNENDEQAKLNEIFSRRSQEAFASTFWNVLTGLSSNEIDYASKIAKGTSNLKWDVGQLVINRENEYLVKLSWLSKIVKKIGFKIILEHTLNDIGEAIILLTVEEEVNVL